MHLLPQLRELERRFERELVIVGVHAGKFYNERETANIRQAALRLGIDHPIVNDRQFRIWRAYAVGAWPTLALIDPAGRHVGSRAGEATAALLAPMVEALVAEAEAKGTMDRRPLTFRPERLAEPARQLAFPSKVLATEDGRLFVADAGHHRIVLARLDQARAAATIETVIGSGTAGLRDDDFAGASFNRPHGMALAGDRLYVADLENHAIRAVDLASRQVTTLAGTGQQAGFRTMAGPALRTALSSPWELALADDNLFVAMAGSHQLWRIDLRRGWAEPYAGSGIEEIMDGPANAAALSQPSGLALDGRRLYFADTESSGVRYADLEQAGQVTTVVGTGLFDFGDVDASGDDARLQHPQGIAAAGGMLYLADTYNHKIRRVNPLTRAVTTFAGSDKAGLQDGVSGQLYEPGGVSCAGGRLYIADTNNHAIRVADLSTGRLWTLELRP